MDTIVTHPFNPLSLDRPRLPPRSAARPFQVLVGVVASLAVACGPDLGEEWSDPAMSTRSTSPGQERPTDVAEDPVERVCADIQDSAKVAEIDSSLADEDFPMALALVDELLADPMLGHCPLPAALELEVRKAWLDRIRSFVDAPSPEAVDPGLDQLAAFLDRFPKDATAKVLADELWARHWQNRREFVAALEEVPGLDVELSPVGGRRFRIEMAWYSPEAARLIRAGRTDVLVRLAATFVGALGARTRTSGFRSDVAHIEVRGTGLALEFPTRCARRVTRLSEQDRGYEALETLKECVQVVSA